MQRNDLIFSEEYHLLCLCVSRKNLLNSAKARHKEPMLESLPENGRLLMVFSVRRERSSHAPKKSSLDSQPRQEPSTHSRNPIASPLCPLPLPPPPLRLVPSQCSLPLPASHPSPPALASFHHRAAVRARGESSPPSPSVTLQVSSH